MRILVTGSAGFIGFHLSNLLLDSGHTVHGYDALTDFGGVELKQRRHEALLAREGFSATIGALESVERLKPDIEGFAPDVIVHLAGQAGVRYSIDQPRSYIDSNLVGTFNILEIVRHRPVKHLLIASSSSVYGANTEMPFKETDRTATPLSLYAATKAAIEVMAHSYAHLWDIPTSMFRFFTVYGPWGRPDMACYKFTKAIMEGTTIDIYNHGDLWRDFTYVDDLVASIAAIIDVVPLRLPQGEAVPEGDSLSPVAPFRILNIGNGKPERLIDFIAAIEAAVGKQALRNYVDMQPGDVHATSADVSLLTRLTGRQATTPIKIGLERFVAWYQSYYGV